MYVEDEDVEGEKILMKRFATGEPVQNRSDSKKKYPRQMMVTRLLELQGSERGQPSLQ